MFFFMCKQVWANVVMRCKRCSNTTPVAMMLLAIFLGGWVSSVQGNLMINATFDASITSLGNAAQWQSAINYAKHQFELQFTDPITINIIFKVDPDETRLGYSTFSGQMVKDYAELKKLLTDDITTQDDKTSVAHLPATDPVAGTPMYLVTSAQAKALKILAAHDPANDGTVTIGTKGNLYTTDASDRAVTGQYDLIGVVSHEITEVMGRIGTANWDTSGNYGPLDLFGYQFAAGGTGVGTLNVAADQDSNYFSIDGGQTALKLFNDHSNGGDGKDWASGSNDSFNAFGKTGVKGEVTQLDLRVMDVIGYDRVVPEPASALLCLMSMGGLTMTMHRRRGACKRSLGNLMDGR